MPTTVRYTPKGAASVFTGSISRAGFYEHNAALWLQPKFRRSRYWLVDAEFADFSSVPETDVDIWLSIGRDRAFHIDVKRCAFITDPQASREFEGIWMSRLAKSFRAWQFRQFSRVSEAEIWAQGEA